MVKAGALAAVCALALSFGLDAKPRIRFGGLVIGAGFSYGAYPYYWSPLYYDPWFLGFNALYPGYWYGFPYGPSRGEVKIQTRSKQGAVFIDGGYAGEVSHLKKMWLDPGVYNIEIRAAGQPTFQQRIYVLTGKTIKIRGVAQ
jgi:hypothetical protein